MIWKLPIPAAYIFQEGDFAIVIPQAMVAVMEVKTTLNAQDFDESIQNIASAKSLMDFPTNLTGIVFGFDGTNPSDEILDVWFRRLAITSFKGKEVLTPEAIIFFTKKQMLVRCNESVEIRPDGKYYHRLTSMDAQSGRMDNIAFQMSVALAMIITACENKQFTISHEFPEETGFSLFQSERDNLSLERFAFGEGKSRIEIRE